MEGGYSKYLVLRQEANLGEGLCEGESLLKGRQFTNLW